MNSAIDSSWILVASGELGDVVSWEPGFEVLEHARDLLCATENLKQGEVDLSAMLDGLASLSAIGEMDFPPLYRENAFEEIDGFLALISEPVVELPMRSINRLDLYIDGEKQDHLLKQFTELVKRLRSHPSLTDYI